MKHIIGNRYKYNKEIEAGATIDMVCLASNELFIVVVPVSWFDCILLKGDSKKEVHDSLVMVLPIDDFDKRYSLIEP